MKTFWYESSLKDKAKELRNNSTLTEVLLWKRLKNKQILGFSFSRQVPIDHFIVDFFNNDLMLAIEVDGSSHNDKEEYDSFREDTLKKLGIYILRFSTDNILNNLNNVINIIKNKVEELTTKINPYLE